jgi:hypothetical protein
VKVFAGSSKFFHQTIKIVKTATNDAVISHLGITTGISNSYGNGVFVNIQTNKCDRIRHDLPPWLWL